MTVWRQSRRLKLVARRSSCSTSACQNWTATRLAAGSAKSPGGKTRCLIALTGWGQDEDRRRTSEAGFDYHLVKPVESSTLVKVFADVTRRDLRGLETAGPLSSTPRRAQSPEEDSAQHAAADSTATAIKWLGTSAPGEPIVTLAAKRPKFAYR